MKQFIFLLITAMLGLCSCTGVADRTYGHTQIKETSDFLNALTPEQTFQVLVDTEVPTINLSDPLYGPPCEKVTNICTVGDMDRQVSTSGYKCTKLPDNFVAGYVLLPITDNKSRKWLSVPAFFPLDIDSDKYFTVKAEYVRTSPDEQGELLLVAEH